MKPFYTVFIPAYNRAKTLPRLLKSIEAQTFRDFECIVVDDGSTDDTQECLARLVPELTFPIRVVRQENQGKHVARNLALDLAKGELFFTVDSDDVMLPEALEKCLRAWRGIPADRRKDFVAVEGLTVHLDSGRVIGSMFPSSPWDSDHIESRFRFGIRGDKVRAVKTSVFRKHKFPVFEGERFIAESYAWNSMGQQYYTRYINEPLVAVDYQADGLSSRSIAIRSKNPRGAMAYYSSFLNSICTQRKVAMRTRVRFMANWVRYFLHAGASGEGRLPVWPVEIMLAWPIGLALWLLDCWQIRGGR